MLKTKPKEVKEDEKARKKLRKQSKKNKTKPKDKRRDRNYFREGKKGKKRYVNTYTEHDVVYLNSPDKRPLPFP